MTSLALTAGPHRGTTLWSFLVALAVVAGVWLWVRRRR